VCRFAAFKDRLERIMKRLSPQIRWVVFQLFLVLVFGPHIGNASEVVERIVAVVNEEIVLLSELDQAYQPYVQKIREAGYPPEKEQQMLYRVREDLINKLVDEKLTQQEVKNNRLSVDPSEVDRMIERIKEANYYSDEDFRKALEMNGLTVEGYRKQLKEQILRNKLVNLEVKSKIVITKEDIKNYYDNHPELYGGKTQYHLRNIFLKYPADSDQDQIAILNQRFDPIIKRLEEGETFETLAREYSESATAEDGGDLGVFSLDSLSEQIRNHIKDLNSGEYTPILRSEQGGQIIFVEEIVDSGGKSLESVSSEIEQKLFKEIMDKKFAEWLENLRARSHIKIIR